jgi:hypothetical protein
MFNACLRRQQKNCRTKKGEHRDRTRPFPKAQVPEDGMPKRSVNGLHRVGSSRVRINKASLQKMPANGKRVRADQIQNKRDAPRLL